MSAGAHTSEALLHSGQEALNRGDFERAVSDFSALTQIAPRAVVAWCGRAAAYFGANEFSRSLAAAKRARELAPNDPRSYFVLAPPAYALADHAAIAHCKSFNGKLDVTAGRPVASFWAQRLSEKNYFPEAADAFASFAARHADDIDVGIQSVDFLLNAFRLEDAETILGRIGERGAPAARIDALFSRIHVARGDVEAARAAARRAIAADPDCIVAYSVLAEVEPAAIAESLDAHLHALISSDAVPIDNRVVGGVALGRAR